MIVKDWVGEHVQYVVGSGVITHLEYGMVWYDG
jgi:hypothetical protein